MKEKEDQTTLSVEFFRQLHNGLLSRRQFIKVAGIGTFGVVLGSPLFLSCTKEHVVQFVNWIAELPKLINDYRNQNGLPSIKLSSKLSAVALAHIRDLSTYQPHQACGTGGNLHSWSNNGNWQGKDGEGNWKGCCYPGDHSNQPCMWEKPKEIAAYQGYGYEIASSASTAQGALQGWKKSPDHEDVILNKGSWSNFPWKAIGALAGGGYACAWFGTVPD